MRQFCGDTGGDGENDEDEDYKEEGHEEDGDDPADAATHHASADGEGVRDSAALSAHTAEHAVTEVVGTSPFVSPAGSAKKRGRPTRSGEGALQWTDPLTEKLIHAR